MNIIIIHEENHGVIGVATNVKAAIQYLIQSDWLNPNFEIFGDDGIMYEVCDLVDDLKDLCDWDIEKFNYVFDGCFYLQEDVLIEEDC